MKMGTTRNQSITEIAEEICEHYCKYPDIWDEEEEGYALCESEVCANCPLNKLLEA